MADRKVVATIAGEILARLTKILREFEKLCGTPIFTPTEPRDLTLFGLTLDEARDWVDHEPSFMPERSPRDKLTPYLILLRLA